MRIICILGYSGSGKSTVEHRLEQIGYNRIISYTTRKMRGNEQDGREYHFVTPKQFQSLIDKDILMEYAEYNGNYYGAPRPVGSINNVIVVESDGYKKIKQLYGKQAIGVYMEVPTDILLERLNNRNDTSDIDIINRALEDRKKFDTIKEQVDLVLDGRNPVDISILNILNYIRSRK